MQLTLNNPTLQDVGAPREVSHPGSFTWTPSFDVFVQGRNFFTNVDVSALASPSGNTYYVDPDATGTGDGSSMTNAFTTIQAALQATNCGKVILAAKTFDWRACGWLNSYPAISQDVAIVCEDGFAETNSFDSLWSGTWEAHATEANVYQRAYTSMGQVIDRNARSDTGNPLPLRKVNSVAEVSSTPGSYYFASNVLYVRLYGDQVPTDVTVTPFRAKKNFEINGSHTVYFENIKFYGGNYPVLFTTVSGSGKQIAFKNCTANYAGVGSGYTIDDIDNGYLLDCLAEENALDGMAYRMNTFSVQTNILEENCVSIRNGSGTTNNSNGSSAHDGAKVIRVMGQYGLSDGPSVSDTHTNTQSLCYGTKALESKSDTSGLTRAGFRVTAGASMWLFKCVSNGSLYQRVQSGAGTLTDLGHFIGDGLDSGTIS